MAAETHWTWEITEGFAFALSTTSLDPMPLLYAHITMVDGLGKAGEKQGALGSCAELLELLWNGVTIFKYTWCISFYCIHPALLVLSVPM